VVYSAMDILNLIYQKRYIGLEIKQLTGP